MDKIQIGNRIREIRKLHKLTQKELGDLIGLSQTAISMIEKGDLSISLDSLYKLCEECKISITEVLNVESEPAEDIIKIMKIVSDFDSRKRRLILILLETFLENYEEK